LNDFNIFKTGYSNAYWKRTYSDEAFFVNFYNVLGLDYNMIYDQQYLKINRDIRRENELYDKIVSVYDKQYIFVHDHRSHEYKSSNPRPNVIVNSDLPIFHPNYNYYEDDKNNKYYNYWNKEFCSSNILDYNKIMENATELHLSDSSFSCLCPYLNLSSIKCKCVYTTYNYKLYNKSFNDWTIVSPNKLIFKDIFDV
jgi:hypothetical protein